MKILVTGGAGFIGSAFIRFVLQKTAFQGEIINVDALTYAASEEALRNVHDDPRYAFIQRDICAIESIFDQYDITHVVHFAAESHVDRSIENAEPFLQSNVVGTVRLLEAIRKRPHIRFHHVSTDEVYGSLGDKGEFTETSPYAPNSPYAASKAASDHFVRAYGKTYGLQITISHCSNNYGPFQHEEKFIPTVIRSLMTKQPIPIYGTGKNVRDWIHVDDHVEAVWLLLCKGGIGEVYNIGGGFECSNEVLAKTLIRLYDPTLMHLITYITDRKGHDFRYALSNEKIKKAFGWTPKISFENGLKATLQSYIDRAIKSGEAETSGISYEGQKKIVCVIPARLHSTRFPKKILYPIGHKPLIQWTYEAALSTGLFDQVIIALDDVETEKIVKQFTTSYYMTSKRCQNGTIRTLEVREKITADIWVNWQCDEPLVSKEMIATLLQGIDGIPAIWTLKKKCKKQEEDDPHVVKIVCTQEGRALYFSREKIPYGASEYWKHIGIYAYADKLLDQVALLPESTLARQESLEQLTFLEAGMPIYAFTTKGEAIGVDVLEDVKKILTIPHFSERLS